MEKVVLIDGNNLMFRSYYATSYSGNLMYTSYGLATNAVYGFLNMFNKIIEEEKPTHVAVAFDVKGTFRHDLYFEYKAKREETPRELLDQFPLIKKILSSMGITCLTKDKYEADDIIGTLSCLSSAYETVIVSSDKDLLQLLSSKVKIKLLKKHDYIYYDVERFMADFGVEPLKIIDLKALEGDQSDNIPGVKGVGPKTALKLLQEYGSLNDIYNNIDNIKGKLKDRLMDNKHMAYMSYKLATIVTDVPLEVGIDDLVIGDVDSAKLKKLYEELEFYSFLKKEQNIEKRELDIKFVTNIKEIEIDGECALYLEVLGHNYHKGEILGVGICYGDNNYFVSQDILLANLDFFQSLSFYTYDAKKVLVALNLNDVITDDLMIASYLLDYNIQNDIAYLANQMGVEIPFYDQVYGKTKFVKPKGADLAYNVIVKARFIYDTRNSLISKLEKDNLLNVYRNIDLPTSFVLAKIERNGVNINKNTLLSMKEELKIKIDLISEEIYNDAGEVFNISSPFKLGDILFEKLGLKSFKKTKRGYSTSIDVLNKLRDDHPIINKIIQYRSLTKLYSAYIENLLSHIDNNNKIHTIYTQTLTRTGRLSSIEPNLQNIPVRYNYGKLIRKAFVPSEDSFILSCDYLQIELRILAHFSSVPSLIEAFNNNIDIHKKTAMDIFSVQEVEVTEDMRRVAKAVNFGIIYGISSFGLSENLHISIKEAERFINEYLRTYPGIKQYMDDCIERAYKNGYVLTLFNRKRTIPELKNKNRMIRQQGERMALNAPIQGTNADIIKSAMIEIDKQFTLRKLKSKMILQVHDELIFDVLKNEIEEVKEIVIKVMENVVTLKVPLKVDINVGDNWYQASE